MDEKAICVMAKQYGFCFDAERCVQCRTCEVTCKSVRNVEPGIRWRRVVETWGGVYPKVTRVFFSLACLHCGKPACIEVCPTGAISKRREDGIVVVDRDKCNGCQDCFAACPYGVPQFGNDGIMQMCDFCSGVHMEPACALSCPAGALSSGNLDELLKMAGRKAVRRMGGPTEPSIVIVGELELASLIT
jgi:anaerobic dimethyl sulfoxide reductase subunit B (iron-sulfur subunit)